MMLGLILMELGKFDASIEELRAAVHGSGELPLMMGWLGLAFGLAKRPNDARRVLAALREISTQRFVLPSTFAWFHLGLDKRDDAFVWMTRAAEHNDVWMHPAKTYPFLDPLRPFPQFAALLHKLNLTD